MYKSNIIIAYQDYKDYTTKYNNKKLCQNIHGASGFPQIQGSQPNPKQHEHKVLTNMAAQGSIT